MFSKMREHSGSSGAGEKSIFICLLQRGSGPKFSLSAKLPDKKESVNNSHAKKQNMEGLWIRNHNLIVRKNAGEVFLYYNGEKE